VVSSFLCSSLPSSSLICSPSLPPQPVAINGRARSSALVVRLKCATLRMNHLSYRAVGPNKHWGRIGPCSGADLFCLGNRGFKF
jgi:hypothetical protein